MIRQGDVLLIDEKELPSGATPEEYDRGQSASGDTGTIILAHGEATGHAHTIRSKYARTYTKGGNRYLVVRDNPVNLRHQEHDTLTIEPGVKRVIRQKEYAQQEVRNVAD